MFPKTNLEFQLKKERGKRVSSEHILEEVQAIFNETDLHRQAIKDRISLPGNERQINRNCDESSYTECFSGRFCF